MSTLLSCRKHIVQRSAELPPVVITGEEEKKIKLIREVAEILENVYANDSAWREVNDSIFKKKYADERVLLADLIFGSPDGIFRKLFWKVAEAGNYRLVLEMKDRPRPRKPLPAGTISGDAKLPVTPQPDIAIYFPYSDLFTTYSRPTIVAADRDADEGPGREAYTCDQVKICYRNVIVNDDYAVRRPTHIITTGAELMLSEKVIPEAKETARVYHGWSKLTKQLDKLISLTGNGGGSEIKICRINGYLQFSDQQVDNFAGDIVTAYYSRSDIRNKRWKRIYSTWDPEWNYQDVEQVYAVYEDDTKGEKTFSGSLTTTVTLPGAKTNKAVGEIGFKINVSTQDELVTQRKISRTGFFKMSRTDQGWGFMPDANDFLVDYDWPIYDGGTIWAYTMPWQAL